MLSATHSLLVFHGSAREAAGSAAKSFAEKLRSDKLLPDCHKDFSICFLRGAEPVLDQAIAVAIANGYKKLRLIPLFLLPGSHTSEEIPAIVARFKSANPAVEFEVSDCLVHNPQFIAFVADQIARD
jgi:sirohydrochlorin cobaltochelatase